MVLNKTHSITTKKSTKTLDISIKGVEWQIKKLKEQGIIKRIGPDKGGHWKVLNKQFGQLKKNVIKVILYQ